MSKTQEARQKLDEVRFHIKGNSQWKHYKGGIYQVKDIVLDTTTGEPAVLYYRIDGPNFDYHAEAGTLYVRPVEEWLGTVENNDSLPHHVSRFVRVRKVERWEEVNNG